MAGIVYAQRTPDEIAAGLAAGPRRCAARGKAALRALDELHGGKAHNPHREHGHLCAECQCQRRVSEGDRHCRVHGGASNSSIESATRRRAEGAVHAELRRVGRPVDTTPAEALQRALELQRGTVEALAAIMDAGDQPGGFHGTPGPTYDDDGDVVADDPMQPGVLGRNRHGELVAHPAAGLYRDALNDLVRTAKVGIDADLDGRRVAVEEAQAVLIGVAIRRILERLELSVRQWDAVPAVSRDVLGALAATT